MKNQMDLKADCRNYRTHLADLLLDDSYISEHPEIAAHVSVCAECRTELEELQATVDLLNAWVAPEPSAYFDAKLHARLREVQASAPDGLWDRMRSFVTFSTGRRLRPAMAGMLACILLLGGGGTFAGLYRHSTVAIQVSPTVNDLKILDKNAQALQQMDQLLDPPAGDSSAVPTT